MNSHAPPPHVFKPLSLQINPLDLSHGQCHGSGTYPSTGRSPWSCSKAAGLPPPTPCSCVSIGGRSWHQHIEGSTGRNHLQCGVQTRPWLTVTGGWGGGGKGDGSRGSPTHPRTPVWWRVSCHACGAGWRDISTTSSTCSSQEGEKSLSSAEKRPQAHFAKKVGKKWTPPLPNPHQKMFPGKKRSLSQGPERGGRF